MPPLQVNTVCFARSDDALLNPVAWLSAYRVLSKFPLRGDKASFVLADGFPLSRGLMVKSTESLLKAAKIELFSTPGEGPGFFLEIKGSPISKRSESE
jgi:hypothetical protein